MPAALGGEVLERPFRRPRLLVGPQRGERVVDVRHGDDAGAQRNVVAHQAVWIPRAVELLVMTEGDERPHAYVLRGAALEDLVADHGVAAHDQPLGLVELGWP